MRLFPLKDWWKWMKISAVLQASLMTFIFQMNPSENVSFLRFMKMDENIRCAKSIFQMNSSETVSFLTGSSFVTMLAALLLGIVIFVVQFRLAGIFLTWYFSLNSCQYVFLDRQRQKDNHNYKDEAYVQFFVGISSLLVLNHKNENHFCFRFKC